MKLIRLLYNGERRDGRLYGLYEHLTTAIVWQHPYHYTIEKVEE